MASGSGSPWPVRWPCEPRLLLLDEPLSALDAGLRERLAGELREILRRAGTTALMVTHDHEEAFAVADRLAVMREGRVVQQGPIADVWRAPADAETALFLGYARVLRGTAASSSWPPPVCRRRPRSPYDAPRCAVAEHGPLAGVVVSSPGHAGAGARGRWTCRSSARSTRWPRWTSTPEPVPRSRLVVEATRLAVIPEP